MRRTTAIEALISWLHLKGVSTCNFGKSLQALVGEKTKGLSANVVVRLKEQWADEYVAWSRRDLSDKQHVYIWADGIHAIFRLEDDGNRKQCFLVLMGATADGRKELIAVEDGALGFWAALRKVFPETAEQPCWVHKSANVLNRMPKSVQPKAKAALHEIWQAETQADAERAFAGFL